MENTVKVPVPVPANELHESYYEVKVEGNHFAPFVPPVVTEADDLKKKLEKSQQDLEDYKALTEERFNKLVALIQKK